MKSIFLVMSLLSVQNFISKIFNLSDKKQTQSQIILEEGEELIYHKRWGNDNWGVIGKTIDGDIYQKCGKDKWTLVGKVEGEAILQKSGKNSFTQVGKYENGLIYQKIGKEGFGVVGKYENGLIYQKLGRKSGWGVIGKSAAPAESALLLLLSNSDGADIIVLTAM